MNGIFKGVSHSVTAGIMLLAAATDFVLSTLIVLLSALSTAVVVLACLSEKCVSSCDAIRTVGGFAQHSSIDTLAVTAVQSHITPAIA
jgi:hypothetical protein